jgi:prevent-host-death family protein
MWFTSGEDSLMAEKTIAAFEARRQFGKMIREVEKGDSYIVERHGEPVVAVVPLRVYERWKRERDGFLDILHKAQQNSIKNDPEMTEEKAMELALEAVAAVRAEMRAERAAARQRDLA